MPGFNPFDMDMDGNVDGIDFLGFHYLMEHVLSPDSSEDKCDELGGDTADDDVSTLDYAPADDEEEMDNEDEGWCDYDIPLEAHGPLSAEEEEFGPGGRYDV